jgi:hypothetical protein
MKIALDYDDTYTRDPKLWEDFGASVRLAGHEITIVTKRGPSNQGPIAYKTAIPVIYTDRKAKQALIASMGLHFDIWTRWKFSRENAKLPRNTYMAQPLYPGAQANE